MRKQHIKSYDEDSMSESDSYVSTRSKSSTSKCCKFIIVLLILGVAVGGTIGYLVASQRM